jgi:prevent-host-death family protein
MDHSWQVQEAKAKFSSLIEAAQETPQTVTRHGAPFAVVLGYAEYERLSREKRRRPLISFLRDWPEFEIPERQNGAECDVDFE